MLYTTNHALPDKFREDNGERLCKLWFVTKYGKELDADLIEEFDKIVDDYIKVEEISQYKLPHPDGEIIVKSGKYCVGDGYGNVIYSPYRKGYDDESKIERKYSVKKV